MKLHYHIIYLTIILLLICIVSVRPYTPQSRAILPSEKIAEVNWDDYYQIKDFPSPDNKWNVQIKFNRDFQNKCFSQISIQNNEKKEVVYVQNDGWRGNYDIECSFDDNPEKGIVGYISSFSGWNSESTSFSLQGDSIKGSGKKLIIKFKEYYWSIANQ